MPSRNFIVVVLAAVLLAGAGVGVVLGKRAAAERVQLAAKPAAKPAEVKSPAPSAAPKKSTSALVPAPKQESDLVFVSRKDLLRVRNAANEAAAIATLRAVSSAQAQAQSAGVIDADGDQAGEYATFGELSGAVPCRAAPGVRRERLEPAILGPAFAAVTQSGNVLRSGYVFRMYLPGPTSSDGKTAGIPESAGGVVAGGSPQPDANNSEILWSLYAWPIEAPNTGARAFFVNQEGDLLSIANADGAYSGEERAPAFDAAFPAGKAGDMAAPPVPGAQCNDGHAWSVVESFEEDVPEPAELGPATEADIELNKRPDSERVVVSRTLMRQARIATDEARAIQTLRVLSMCEAQMQAAGVIDTDGDSKGEYAYFAEMAGAVPFRASPGSRREKLNPAILDPSFGKVSSAGNLVRSGYVFRIYLPGPRADRKVPGLAECGGGGAATQGAKPDHDGCEVRWSAYAWPVDAGKSGTHAFFVNQDGDLYWTPNEDGAYSGEAHAPAFDAALGAHKPEDMQTPMPAPGAKSNDGKLWTPVS